MCGQSTFSYTDSYVEITLSINTINKSTQTLYLKRVMVIYKTINNCRDKTHYMHDKKMCHMLEKDATINSSGFCS